MESEDFTFALVVCILLVGAVAGVALFSEKEKTERQRIKYSCTTTTTTTLQYSDPCVCMRYDNLQDNMPLTFKQDNNPFFRLDPIEGEK